MVSDEVVINDEDLLAPPKLEQRIEFRQQLAGRLGPRLPSVDGDDVAEFALEGTAPRELHRHGSIFSEVKQVKAWKGSLADIRLVLDDVQPFGSSALKIRRNLWKSLIGLAHHDVVCNTKKGLGFTAREGTTNYGPPVQGPSPLEGFANVVFLDAHSADHHEIGPKDVGVQQVLEASVDQTERPGFWTQRRYCQQARGRLVGFDGNEVEYAVHTPEGRGESRPHQENF